MGFFAGGAVVWPVAEELEEFSVGQLSQIHFALSLDESLPVA